MSLKHSLSIYHNNIDTTYLCANSVCHSHLKHIVIDFHFVHDKVFLSQLHVSHISTQYQQVDVLTKPLSRQRLLLL